MFRQKIARFAVYLSVLTTASIITSSLCLADGLEYTETNLVGADLVAFNHYRKHGAYYLTSHYQERAGDTYVMPNMRPVKPIMDCYRNVSIPTPLNQGAENSTDNEALDINIEIEGKWFYSANIKIKLLIKPNYEVNLSETSLSQVDDKFKEKNNWRLDKCPWLEYLFINNQFDGIHIPIHTVFYAEGSFKSDLELKVTASAEFETSKITEIVEKLKTELKGSGFENLIPDFKLRAAVSGGYAKITEHRRSLNEVTPTAFIPYLINKEAMNIYLSVVGYGGDLLEKYAFSLRSPENAARFLNDFPQLRMNLTSETFVPPLLRSGEVEIYSPDNNNHAVAISAELFFIQANALASQLDLQK